MNNDKPLVISKYPIFYAWDVGNFGHAAWRLGNFYSSLTPDMTPDTTFFEGPTTQGQAEFLMTKNLGAKEREVRSGFPMRLTGKKDEAVRARAFHHDHNDQIKHAGGKSEIVNKKLLSVEIPGLNLGAMRLHAKRHSIRSNSTKPISQPYVVDTMDFVPKFFQDDKSQKNAMRGFRVKGTGNRRYNATRSNCVSWSLSLFCAGLEGIKLEEQFLKYYRPFEIGPKANSLLHAFMHALVDVEDTDDKFIKYEHVRHVYDICTCFNTFHPKPFGT